LLFLRGIALTQPDAFAALVTRVRAGDPAAAAELVRQYEPEIRRVVRLRLTDVRLRRAVDSVDVCQSVLARFFVGVAAGEFDLAGPEQLVKLLARMARNRVIDHARREQAAARDRRREQGSDSALANLADRAETPSRVIAGRELLGEVHRRLSDEERYLAEQRQQGRDWADLAAELGKGPEGLRKQLTRALERVARELRLGETGHA
jgi:RNA polymerase sigma-70 factor (ECF subfamily)